MSSCINQNTPEFERLVERSGDPSGVVAAIVGLWQSNNAVDTIPTTQEYQDYKIQIQGQGFSNMYYTYFEKLAQNLNDNWSKERGENVVRLLERFKRSIVSTSKDVETKFPQLALQRLLRTAERGVVTPEYVAEAIEELNMYLDRSDLYLQGMVTGLRSFLKTNASVKDKVAAIMTAYETADNFKRQLDAIFPEDEDFVNMVSSYKPKNFDKLNTTRGSMKTSIDQLEKLYKNNIGQQVVDELWTLFSPNAAAVKKLFQDNIDRLEQQLRDTTSESQKALLRAKITREKEKLKKGELTKENIKEWINNPKGNWFALMLKSGSYMADPGTQVMSKYIYNVVEDATSVFFQEVNTLQDLMERIQTLMGEQLDIRDMYKGFYRETVDEYGNFALVLQSPMKDQELRNERFKLKKAISEAETEDDRKVAVENYKNFEKTYVERYFIDEYYAFRELLPEDIKEKMDEIRDEINAIISRMDGIDVSEGDLEALKVLNRKLRNMAKETDDFGNLKSPEEIQVARTLQAYNQRAQEIGVHDFYLDSSSSIQYNFALKEQEDRLKEILEGPGSEQEKEIAKENFARWTSYYSRDVIAPEFYNVVKRITDQIDEITSRYEETTMGKNLRKIRTMLMGYRDSNGVYDGTEVTEQLADRIRQLEEEIEEFKTTKRKSGMSASDATTLEGLFRELSELQYSGPTEYYAEEVENRKALIRSEILKTQTWEEGPELEDEVDKKFEQSEWFTKNHVYTERYIDGKLQIVPKPISIWRQTVPTQYAIDLIENASLNKANQLEQQDPVANRDEIKRLREFKVLQKRVPSKVWYKYRVNPRFENPNWSPNTNFKIVPGAYYNQEWDTLSPEKKSIAQDLLNLYLGLQEGSYSQNRRNTILPYHRKEGLELALDTVALKRKGIIKNAISEVKAAWNQQDFQNPDVDDVYGEVTQMDAFGNPLEKASKVIYMRYVQPLDKGVMSYDMMKGIGLFMGESIKFRALREHQNAILAMQQVAERKGINSATQTTQGIIDRVLYGQNMKKFDSEVRNKVASMMNFTLRQSGAMSLEYNIESTIKNLMAGMVQNFILAGNYDVTLQDLQRGRAEAALATVDWVLNPQVGNRPLRLRVLDNFLAIQGRDFTQGAYIKSTPLRKFGNIFKFVQRLREFTEFEIQATLAYAIMDKVYVEGPNGQRVKLKDAYIIRNNRLVVRDGFTIPESLVRNVRAKIKHMNHHAQGLYDQLYQPEGSKYVMYRILFFMGKWRIPKMERYFGKDNVDYMAAIRTEGAYMVLWQFATDVVKYQKNFIAAYQTLTPTEKKALLPIWKTAVSVATYIILQSILKDCDDDGDQNMCDYQNWLIKGVGDEIESMDPIMTPTNFIYGFVDQKTQVSAPERVMNQIASPITKVWKIFSDPALHMFDPMEPYYKKTSAGKINWDATDPVYAGKPSIAVLALKLSGFGELDVSPLRAEFKSRSFTHFNPKFYVEKTKTRYIDEYGNKKAIEFEEKDEEGKPIKKSKKGKIGGSFDLSEDLGGANEFKDLGGFD